MRKSIRTLRRELAERRERRAIARAEILDHAMWIVGGVLILAAGIFAYAAGLTWADFQ